MRPPVIPDQQRLFSANLMEQLNPRNEWLLLAPRMPWAALDAQFGSGFAPGFGRPAIPTRTILGLLLVKQMRAVSDEGVIGLFLESPYVQAFCGYTEFRHEAPCEASTLTRWRKRKGKELEGLLAATLAAALASGALREKDLDQVVVDTTVQEKAVAPPSDARLLYKLQRKLVREARARGIAVLRPGLLVSRRALARHARLRRAAVHRRRADRQVAILRRQLRRVERQVAREFGALDERLVAVLHLAAKLRAQSRSRALVPARERVYAIHAPEVECIAKGKAHKPYEFGVKTAVAMTAKRSFVTAALTQPGNPYDGATLKATLEQMKRITGVTPSLAAVDQGYRGKRYHPPTTGILIPGTRRFAGALLRLAKRRSAVEPVIGHLKNEHGLSRNRLLGEAGDRFNALMSACAWNLMQVVRHLARYPRVLWHLIAQRIAAQLVLMRLRLEYLRSALRQTA